VRLSQKLVDVALVVVGGEVWEEELEERAVGGYEIKVVWFFEAALDL
jgi:hypothetical protein